MLQTPTLRSGRPSLLRYAAHTMNLCYRRASLEDLASLCRLGNEVNLLHHAALPEVFAPITDDRRDEMLWKKGLEGENSATFIAERDSLAIGFVTGHVEDEPAAHFNPVRICHVGTLGVTSAERGKGVGSELMSCLEAWALTRSASEVHLNVWTFNVSAALLYKELGYEARAQFMVKRLRASTA